MLGRENPLGKYLFLITTTDRFMLVNKAVLFQREYFSRFTCRVIVLKMKLQKVESGREVLTNADTQGEGGVIPSPPQTWFSSCTGAHYDPPNTSGVDASQITQFLHGHSQTSTLHAQISWNYVPFLGP